MPRTKYLALHLVGVIVCSVIACVLAGISTGIALSPIINRQDDVPRTEAAFTGWERFCGFISEGMAYPFLWIPPHLLNSTESLILFAGAWGIVFYLFFRSILWVVYRLWAR